MRMQSTALDSSRSQLCNDTSTGVVRHQTTKWRRLQKVVSYDNLHHTKECATEDQILPNFDELGLVGKCVKHSFRIYMGCFNFASQKRYGQ